MSVIQRIQQRQKWVFGAIALALILFILQDKLMGKGGSALSLGNSTSIGKINGESIERTDYDQQRDLYKQEGYDDNNAGVAAWQNMVATTVLKQEFEKAGVGYSMKEFGEDINSNEPPSWFRQTFTDRQTGVYDVQKATAYMANVTPQLRKSAGNAQAVAFQKAVLDPSVVEGMNKKYQSLITGAAYIPKWMADKTAADNNSITNVSFVNVPYSSIPDSTITVSDDEINSFVKKHANEFEQKEETRQVAYVAFDAAPSAKDTADTEDKVASMRREFSEATDVKSYLDANGTTLPYSDKILGKSQIHQPVNDSLFKLQPGQVYGPYKDAGNFVLAKMVETKVLPDSVKVRHILVATAEVDPQSGQIVGRRRDDSAALKRLDSAIAEIKSGKNFDSVCLKYSDDGSAASGGILRINPNGYIATGQTVDEFNDFSFKGKKGDTGTVKTVFGYHFIQILDQKGSEPAYKIAYLGKAVTVSEETDAAAQNNAAKFAGTVHNVKEFYDEAAKLKLSPFTAANIKENDFTINNPGMGMRNSFGVNRAFIKWVYSGNVGDVSPTPQPFTQKYVVAVVTGINKAGLPSAEFARPMVENKLKADKKAKMIIDNKIKGNTLEAIAQANNVTVQQADSVSFQGYALKNAGVEIAVVGAAFNKALTDKVSPPIKGEAGVFVIKPSAIAGVPPQGSAEAQRSAAVVTLKSAQSNFTQYLIKAADIKDDRSKFY